MKEQIKFKTIKMITILEIIIVIFFAVLTVLLGYENSKYAYSQETNYLKEKIKENDNELKNNIIKISEISYGILTSEEAGLLKGHYYDRIGDYYGKSVAVANLRKEVVNLASFYYLIDNVALKIDADDEYEATTLYSFEGSGITKNEFDNALDNYTFSNDISSNLQIYNGNLYYFYSPSKNDKSVMAFRFSNDELISSFLISTLKKQYSRTYINDDGGLMIFCSNYSMNDEKIDYYLYNNGIKENSLKRIYINDVVCYKIPIVIVTNNEFLLKRDSKIITLIVLCVLIILIGSIYLFVTLRFVNRPVNNIINAMQQVGQGKMDVKITEKTQGDLQIINDGFNNMVDSLNSYVNENYIYQMKIVESEFKTLQAQINPHFLYNCFANISSLCKLNEVEKAQEFTAKLSYFFLYITKNNEPLVKLKDEYNHMLLYLDIQKIRFNERVNINVDQLTPDIENVIIPKLAIQPIVENAYKHVFSNIISNGELKITVDSDDTNVSITIEDNGNLSQEDIDTLNKNIEEGKTDKTGLLNVKKRLNYFSKDRANLLLSKSSLGGLKVQIIVPRGETNEN